MTRKPLSQVRILLYRTWPICVAELLNARQQRLLENRESVRIGGGCFGIPYIYTFKVCCY